MKNKVLFITKPFIIEPLGIGNLSSVLKQNGYIVDLIQISENINVTIEQIKQINPDFICYSVWTGGHNYFFDFNNNIKKSGVKSISVFGGAHCTFFNGKFKISEGDYVIKGEADLALAELLNNVNEGKDSPQIIKVTTPPQNLDLLPFPDREILYKYRKNYENPIRSLMCSRGCPYNCTFCYNENYEALFEGSRVRFRNVKSVIDEAEEVKKKYPYTKYFFFTDDELGSRRQRLEILQRYWRKQVGLPFHLQMRVEYINKESIQMLKDSGCDSITFAIESGCYETRKNVLNKKFTNELILEKVNILHKEKMKFRVENMIGIPCEDTLKDMWETYCFNKKLRGTISWSSLFTPYPGTSLGDKCVKMNLYDGNVDSVPEAFFDKTILKFPMKTVFQLNKMQKIFSLLVRFRVPKLIAWVIIKLPFYRLYKLIGFKYKQHLYNYLYKF